MQNSDNQNGSFPRFGLCLMYPSPGVIERIGPDWDWIWIDTQHGEIGYQDALAMVRAADLIHRPAFVRVASHEPGSIGQALDMGATGVIVPCVNTPEQAKSILLAAKFPPLGERSYGSRRMIDLNGRDYSDRANAETMLVPRSRLRRQSRTWRQSPQRRGLMPCSLGPTTSQSGVDFP